MTDLSDPRLQKGLNNHYPLTYVKTREEGRLLGMLKTLSLHHYGDHRALKIWSAASGLDGDRAVQDPLAVLDAIRHTKDDVFYVLHDLPSLFEGHPVLVRALRDLYRDLEGRQVFVFLSHPKLLLPDELKGQMWLVDLGMPTGNEILA